MRVFIAVFGLVLSLLVASWVVGSISLGRPGGWIDDRLSRTLGLDATIEGELRLDLFPPGFEVGRLTLRRMQAPADAPPLARVERLELDLHPWRLLRGQVEIDELHLLGAVIHLTGDLAQAPQIEDIEQVEREGEASMDDPRMRIRRIHIEPLELVYQEGIGAPVTTVRFESLSVGEKSLEQPIELEAHGAIEGSPFHLDGRLGTLPELLDTTRPFPVELSGALLGTELELRGTLASPTTLEGLDLVVDAVVPSADVLLRDPRWPVPRTGRLALHTRITDPQGAIALSDLALETMAGDPLQLRISGSVMDVAALRGVDLSLDLETEDGALFEPLLSHWISKPLGLGPVRLSARLTDPEGAVGVSGTARAQTADGRLSLELEGGDPDLERDGDLQISAELSAENLRAPAELLDFDSVPAIGPVTVSGRVHDRAGVLGADDVRASVGTRGKAVWLELFGAVESFRSLSGVRLDSEFGAENLRDLEPYVNRTLPPVGPITGEARLGDGDGTLGLEHLRVRGGRSEVLEIDVAGGFDDLRAWDEIELRVRVNARDLSVIGALAQAELPAIGPVEVDVRARGSDEELEWTGRTRLDKSLFEGSWVLSFAPGERPLLTGIVTSPQIYLDDVGIEPRATSDGDPARVPEVGGEDWFQTRLPFENLRRFDARIVLDAHHVRGRAGLELFEVDASARLDNGLLSLDEARLVYESGRVRASGVIDARFGEPSISLRGDAIGVDTSLLMAQLTEEPDHGGMLNAEIDLRSTGETPAELVRDLDGELALVLREASLASRYARRFVADLVKVSMPRLSFRRAPSVGCGALRLVASDGVARVHELRIDSDRVSVQGQGQIDLGGNRYDLTLVPEPHDPGLVSVAVTVHVTGPLSNPRFRPVPLSLGTSLARGIYSNAKRPLGAVARPLETVKRPLGAVWNLLRRGSGATDTATHPCDAVDELDSSAAR